MVCVFPYREQSVLSNLIRSEVRLVIREVSSAQLYSGWGVRDGRHVQGECSSVQGNGGIPSTPPLQHSLPTSHTHMHTYTHTHTHTHTHAHTRTRMHTHTHMHAHAHAHTHTGSKTHRRENTISGRRVRLICL